MERYRTRREYGLCCQCGRAEALPGKTYCMDCLLWKRQSRGGDATGNREWLARRNAKIRRAARKYKRDARGRFLPKGD